MWPRTLDMSKQECRIMLRKLELETYANIISSFRAQGTLDQRKTEILSQLRSILQIDPDRHRSETRRATNDEELSTIAKKLFGEDAIVQWTREGKRGAPLLYRSKPYTSLTVCADQATEWIRRTNKLLPEPSCILRSTDVGIEQPSPENLIVADPVHSSTMKHPLSIRQHVLQDIDSYPILKPNETKVRTKKGRMTAFPKTSSNILECLLRPNSSTTGQKREKVNGKRTSGKTRKPIKENNSECQNDKNYGSFRGDQRYQFNRPRVLPLTNPSRKTGNTKTMSRKIKGIQKSSITYVPNDDYVGFNLNPPTRNYSHYNNSIYKSNQTVPIEIMEDPLNVNETEKMEEHLVVKLIEGPLAIDYHNNITSTIGGVGEDLHPQHIEVEEIKIMDEIMVDNVIEFREDKKIIYDPNDSSEIIEEEEYDVVYENGDYEDIDHNGHVYVDENDDFVVDSKSGDCQNVTDFEQLLDTVHAAAQEEGRRNDNSRINQDSS